MSNEYPHLRKFVTECIVPSELEGFSDVIDVYVNLIITSIQNPKVSGLDAMIHNISPWPAWLDFGASSYMNQSTRDLTGSVYVAELKVDDSIEMGKFFRKRNRLFRKEMFWKYLKIDTNFIPHVKIRCNRLFRIRISRIS